MKVDFVLVAFLVALVLAVAGEVRVRDLRSDLAASTSALAVADERARLAVVANERARGSIIAAEAAAAACRADTPARVAEAVTAERGACAGLIQAAEARGRLSINAGDLPAVVAALRARRKRKR